MQRQIHVITNGVRLSRGRREMYSNDVHDHLGRHCPDINDKTYILHSSFPAVNRDRSLSVPNVAERNWFENAELPSCVSTEASAHPSSPFCTVFSRLAVCVSQSHDGFSDQNYYPITYLSWYRTEMVMWCFRERFSSCEGRDKLLRSSQ